MYRLTAGLVVVYNSKILSGLKHSRYWNMPQGGIEENETPFEAAQRELFEETNIDPKLLTWPGETDWFYCEIPEDKRRKPFTGQKHKWFLGLCATKPEVKICPEEYTDYKWAWPDEIVSDVSGSFKEELYLYVLGHFGLI
jgi:putative (di)nucleoside polyphosphate hydrolase